MPTQNPEAIALIKEQLSLPSDPSSWSYEQGFRYRQSLAAYEAANPGQFPLADTATVNRIENKDFDPLVDDSFSLSDFGANMLEEAKKDIGICS